MLGAIGSAGVGRRPGAYGGWAPEAGGQRHPAALHAFQRQLPGLARGALKAFSIVAAEVNMHHILADNDALMTFWQESFQVQD